MESAYDLTAMLDKRYTRMQLFWRRLGIVVLYVLTIATAAFAISSGIGALLVGSVAGIIIGSVTLIAAAYVIVDQVAMLIETFGAHGYNFMRDGLYGGNAELHRTMALVAVAVMAVGSIASNMVKQAAVSRATQCLKECFKAGTLVLCLDENGEECQKPIEDIEVGDLVWAYDEETGEQAYKEVVQLSRNVTSAWCTVSVQVDGKTSEITSTPGHKYYLPDNEVCREVGEKHEHAGYENLSVKWVSAANLKAGDRVLLSDGKYCIIIKSEKQTLSVPETTYNFEVADFHTYYVGDQCICVHNAACEWKWGKGSFDSPEKSLRYHAEKHASKFGLDSTDTAAYLKKAQNFAETVTQRGVKAGKLVEGFTSNIRSYTYTGKTIWMDKTSRTIINFFIPG